MKKKFIYDVLCSTIQVLKNKLKMLTRPRSLMTISLSIIGFCVGITVTSISISAVSSREIIVKEEEPLVQNSVGGLETATVPEYNENLTILLDEAAAEEEFSADSTIIAETEEIAEIEKEETEALITYQTYRVKAGDMIGYIADDFGVTQDTIISVNNIKQSRLIQIGQYLKIPSMPGIIYTVKKNGETPETVAAYYKVDAQKFADVNSMEVTTELKVGQSFFVPDAALDWATRQEINGDLFKKPLHVRYWLSSPYGWRDSPFNTGKRTFHGGIDMAVSQGTPIYAALDGKVTATGYNATYGNYVIITHHSGYKTLYGHMSQITCKKDNFVYTNTMIGRVGSTGMSTGPHLHFTVYKNGKTINPDTVLN